RKLQNNKVCFRNGQKDIVHMGQSLIEYFTMNTTAMHKILKKYDKVIGSDYSRKFTQLMQTKHICCPFSCDLDSVEPLISMILPDSIKLDYNLTFPICLELLFNPYALSLGHLFCKLCVYSSTSVIIFEGLDSSTPQSKSRVCPKAGVFAKSIEMVELELLLKKRSQIRISEG
ncbi:probable E3 ubiquitin-protein ligase BAH1-like 1, partial [Impatiens glandulifera]|uniref:probable E3 ubiquitin-protein ligase BAH1-like 1 n=1 Tax=Impatiens glandulifera TaxID=253017 RepID=UPI001FB16F8F